MIYRIPLSWEITVDIAARSMAEAVLLVAFCGWGRYLRRLRHRELCPACSQQKEPLS